MMDNNIKNVIRKFIELYRENPLRWNNERYSHYDFYKLLFKEFDSKEILNNFKWEFPVGLPNYATGTKEAAVDIIFTDNNEKYIAIEIEMVGAGKELTEELERCVWKLKTSPKCIRYMKRGFIIPILKCDGNKKARGYGGKTYSEICNEAVNNARELIENSPIEIITDGIIFD